MGHGRSQEATQPPAAIGDAPALDALARFRRRARLFFTALAFLSVIVGGVVITLGGADRPVGLILVAAIGVVIGLVVDVVLVFALAERRSWADRATVIVCAILLAAGMMRSAIRLAGGTVEIPLDAIGAALVLAVRPATFAPDGPGDRRRIALVVAAAIIGALWALVGEAARVGPHPRGHSRPGRRRGHAPDACKW